MDEGICAQYDFAPVQLQHVENMCSHLFQCSAQYKANLHTRGYKVSMLTPYMPTQTPEEY